MTTTALPAATTVSKAFRSWLPLMALVLWTLFVWGGRLRNMAIDPGGFGAASRWSLASSVVFVVLAGSALAGLVLRWPSKVTVATTRLLGAVTIGVWVYRGIGIVSADHSAAFIAIHAALALVSIGLAAWALKTAGLQRRHGLAATAG